MQAGMVSVLVGEDDGLQREVLTELLELEGYQVLGAAGPTEVLARLEDRPDVVLLDLVGVATPAVRAALTRPGAPPLVVVSGDAGGAREAARLKGAWLEKPFGVEALLATLKTVLARRRAFQVA